MSVYLATRRLSISPRTTDLGLRHALRAAAISNNSGGDLVQFGLMSRTGLNSWEIELKNTAAFSAIS